MGDDCRHSCFLPVSLRIISSTSVACCILPLIFTTIALSPVQCVDDVVHAAATTPPNVSSHNLASNLIKPTSANTSGSERRSSFSNEYFPGDQSVSFSAALGFDNDPAIYAMEVAIGNASFELGLTTSSDVILIPCSPEGVSAGPYFQCGPSSRCSNCYTTLVLPNSIAYNSAAQQTAASLSFPNISAVCMDKPCNSDDVALVPPPQIGLNRDKLSFPSQLSRPPYNLQNVFSYCLVEFAGDTQLKTSKITFGDAALEIKKKTASMKTMTLLTSYNPTYYIVKVREIVIDSRSIPLQSPYPYSPMTALFDIADHWTSFPPSQYDAVLDAFQGVLRNYSRVNSVNFPDFFCIQIEDLEGLAELPQVVLRFDEIDVQFDVRNFMFVDLKAEHVACLGIRRLDLEDNRMILGSLSQQNFRVVMDNVNSQISIGRDSC